jgi:hypothetical protein
LIWLRDGYWKPWKGWLIAEVGMEPACRRLKELLVRNWKSQRFATFPRAWTRMEKGLARVEEAICLSEAVCLLEVG